MFKDMFADILRSIIKILRYSQEFRLHHTYNLETVKRKNATFLPTGLFLFCVKSQQITDQISTHSKSMMPKG